MKKTATLLAFVSLAGFLPCTPAADYQGAETILKQAASRQETQKPAEDTGTSTTAKLKSDIKAFRTESSKLPPDEAAKRWVGLVDRLLKVHRGDSDDGDASNEEPLSIEMLMMAVPPPPAWDAIAALLENRPETRDPAGFQSLLLKLIAHRLAFNNKALAKELDRLGEMFDKGVEQEISSENAIGLKQQLASYSDDGDAIIKGLNDRLDQFSKPQHPGPRRYLNVPDLVTLAGREKAAEFLKRALKSPAIITIRNGLETSKLARELALKNISSMKASQWGLVDSIDAMALYEAMEKRFPEGREHEDNYKSARCYYLLGLIAAHRTKEATALVLKLGDKAVESLPENGMEALKHAGLADELTEFLHDVLAQKPELPFWSEYTELAVEAGKKDEMVRFVEDLAARQGLNEKSRSNVAAQLLMAYLAADRVDDGVAVFRKRLAEAAKQAPVQAGGDGDESRINPEPSPVNQGIEFAELGDLLGRKELVEEGLQSARDALKKEQARPEKRDNDSRHSDALALAVKLQELGRGPEAEAVLGDDLAAYPKKRSNQDFSSGERDALLQLISVYHDANRPADVVELLDHAPQWGGADFSMVLTSGVSINRNVEYLGYYAAAALAALDRKAEARKILDALMDRKDDYDPAYELLIKLATPEEAIARCDELSARDKFESRPLIWKAKLLLDAGKLEEAEAAARQAVSIDPSDGEHGPGRRMRVYAVLADIREARGDKKEAELFRGVVTAIRHSEDADRFYNAGLITRAIKMYEESLTHFSEAYCIQSRLALRMAESGDMAGAEEHYRKAYELMPDSFGRVESHCFGCERAFSGLRAQSIAEKVFTGLAKSRPDKPQVHYLLGYLRMEQERYAEALPEFREAVKLDPEYLNAWIKISQTGHQMRLSVAEHDAVVANILRLDPLGHHSDADIFFEDASGFFNLKTGWNACEAVSKLRPPKTAKNLYPLAAAAAEAAKNRNSVSFSDDDEGREKRLDPAYLVAHDQFIQTVVGMFGYGPMLFREQQGGE